MHKITKCTYHPEKQASHRCDDCNKPICYECERSFHVEHSGNTHQKSYTESFRLCPLCKNERVHNKKGIGQIQTIVSSAFFIFIPIWILTHSDWIGYPVFYVNFFFLFVGLKKFTEATRIYINLPKEKRKSEEETQQFLETLHQIHGKTKKRKKYRTRIVSKKEGFYCFQCGHELPLDALFCAKCGDSTADERASLFKKRKR